MINVLGFSGSLRKASSNSGLLRAAKDVLPENMTLEIFDLSSIPLFNLDIESNLPEPVRLLREKITSADALLIAVTEYNYSISGVLKNAIDWASRPAQNSSLNGKPFAMMGAGGGLGTARAQYHLRQIAVYTNMYTFNKPELIIPRAFEKFDKDGNLLDESIKERIKALLEALAVWVMKFKSEI